MASLLCSELKLLCVASPFQLVKLCQVGPSPCTLPLVAKENRPLLARLQPGRHFPHLSFNCSLHREEQKAHLNPANSGIKIKAGEECYFAIAGGLQGVLVLQWCWDASLLMNCLCEITKHTVTKSSKETRSSNSANHPAPPDLQLHIQTEKNKKVPEIIFGQFCFGFLSQFFPLQSRQNLVTTNWPG